jgi:hypothetical protein
MTWSIQMEEVEQSLEELDAETTEVEETTEAEVEVDSESELETEQVQPEDDDEEIEHEGERYKVPKALKPLLMFQQDYTRKTQEVAEVRKAVEAEQAAVKHEREFISQHLDTVTQLKGIEAQLAQYSQIDWQKEIDTDPVHAMKLDRQYQSLKEAYNGTLGKLQQDQEQFALNKQQQTAKQVEQAAKVLTSEFKDWSPEVANELTSYLKGYERLGFNDEILGALHRGEYGALPIIWARKAQLYDQMQQKAAKKPQQSPPPKPVTKVGAKATVTKDPSQMSDAEFAAWRKRQIAQRK